jgi:hypothetical protein
MRAVLLAKCLTKRGALLDDTLLLLFLLLLLLLLMLCRWDYCCR